MAPASAVLHSSCKLQITTGEAVFPLITYQALRLLHCFSSLVYLSMEGLPVVKGDVVRVGTWCTVHPAPPMSESQEPCKHPLEPCKHPLQPQGRPQPFSPACSVVSRDLHPSLSSADIQQRWPWKCEYSPTHLELHSQL